MTDFPFLRLNQSFAISKFVYLNPVAVDLGYKLIRTFVISMINKFPATLYNLSAFAAKQTQPVSFGPFHPSCGGNSVQEVGGGGGKALRIFDKFVLILHIFFFFDNHGLVHGNDKTIFYKHNVSDN